jgi:hypothetical protein
MNFLYVHWQFLCMCRKKIITQLIRQQVMTVTRALLEQFTAGGTRCRECPRASAGPHPDPTSRRIRCFLQKRAL